MHYRHHNASKLPGRLGAPSLAAILAIAAAASSGCARSEITAPSEPTVGQLTVDASKAWVYVDLSSGAATAQTSAGKSLTCNIGFNATSIQLNGGTSGPAGMTGFCVRQNAAATNDQILGPITVRYSKVRG